MAYLKTSIALFGGPDSGPAVFGDGPRKVICDLVKRVIQVSMLTPTSSPPKKKKSAPFEMYVCSTATILQLPCVPTRDLHWTLTKALWLPFISLRFQKKIVALPPIRGNHSTTYRFNTFSEGCIKKNHSLLFFQLLLAPYQLCFTTYLSQITLSKSHAKVCYLERG